MIDAKSFLRSEVVRKHIDALRMRFNSTVRYKERFYDWDTVIRLKAQGLASYILGRATDLDFDEPKPVLHRRDYEAIRNGTLSMTTAEARKFGMRRNTL